MSTKSIIPPEHPLIRTMPGDADAEDKARLGRARALGVQESVIIGHSGCCL
jgi:hypothetical protein